MRAFYSDHFVLPLPDGHRFPMAKYARLRERILAERVVSPDDLSEAPATSWDECRRAGLPVAVAMGGGYATDIDAIVTIHANTIRTAWHNTFVS